MKRIIKTSELKRNYSTKYKVYYEFSLESGFNIFIKEHFRNEVIDQSNIFIDINKAINTIVIKFKEDYIKLKDYYESFICKEQKGVVNKFLKDLMGLNNNISIEYEEKLKNLEELNKNINEGLIKIIKLNEEYYIPENVISFDENIYIVDIRNPLNPKFEKSNLSNIKFKIHENNIDYIYKIITFDVDEMEFNSSNLVFNNKQCNLMNSNYYIFLENDDAYEFSINYLKEYQNKIDIKEIGKAAKQIDKLFES